MKIFQQARGSGPDEYGIRASDIAKYGGIAVGALIVMAGIFVWVFCRIEVEKGEFVPLLKKTGTDILARSPEFKAPPFEIFQEGRHFRNPYNWSWPKPIKATVIEKGQVGVVIRRGAGPLAEGSQAAHRYGDEDGREAP